MAEDGVDGAQKVYVYVDDLEGEALNYAVHYALGHTLKLLNDNDPQGQWVSVFGPRYDQICVPLQRYGASNILAMDLIQEARLTVLAPQRTIGEWKVQYHCSGEVDYCNPAYQSESYDLAVAVARCFVKIKKGEQIFVPLSMLNEKQKESAYGKQVQRVRQHGPEGTPEGSLSGGQGGT